MSVIREAKAGHVAGTFSGVPSGIILHGSRSGRPQSLLNEYIGTANWAATGRHDLGWNVTVGDNRYCVHMTARQWGWNAREHSQYYLAVEFAQPTVNDAITDGQVAAFAAWWRAAVLPVWPTLTPERTPLPVHSEMPAGRRDGKSDTWPAGDLRNDQLRARIRAAMAEDDDAILEAFWQANRARLGEKRGAALLRRDWAGSKTLLFERGAATVIAGQAVEITARLIDDVITYAEGDKSLTRW